MSARKPLVVFRSVIFALMMRDLKSRFSDSRAGYVWAFLEPAFHIGALSIMYYVGGRTTAIYGIAPPVMITMGIVPWFAFRDAFMGCLDAVKENRGLFDYKQVKPIDAMLAKSLLNAIINAFVYITFMMFFYWVGFEVPIDDPLGIILLFVSCYLLGLNLGIYFGVWTTLYRGLKRAIKAIIRPLYFISGVFFTIEMIPEDGRVYILWNPMLHLLDLIKEAHIGTYESPGVWEYPVLFTLAASFVALMLYRQSASKLVARS